MSAHYQNSDALRMKPCSTMPLYYITVHELRAATIKSISQAESQKSIFLSTSNTSQLSLFSFVKDMRFDKTFNIWWKEAAIREDMHTIIVVVQLCARQPWRKLGGRCLWLTAEIFQPEKILFTRNVGLKAYFFRFTLEAGLSGKLVNCINEHGRLV